MGWTQERLRDPDHEICDTYTRGVPLGVDAPLPTTPSVFPPKSTWRLKHHEDADGTKLNDNYKSGKELRDIALEKFQKQEHRDTAKIMFWSIQILQAM